MRVIAQAWLVLCGLLAVAVLPARAEHQFQFSDCADSLRKSISFVQVDSYDFITKSPLKVKGKLTLPVDWQRGRCATPKHRVAAVVILHGSSGIDFRGNFYSEALTDAGIATLEIDMWEARGITSGAGRPPLPMYTYPDAFAALAYLAAFPGIDPQRIGVLGFSWGGVMAMASATEGVVSQFGGGQLRFKAHVAHYPICYAYNNPRIPNSEFGSAAGNPLTGAPILVEIGDQDDYDKGAGPCQALQAGLAANEQTLMRVNVYPGAYHAWDRLLVPTTEQDPFANLGLGGPVRIVPNVADAYASRTRVVAFFRHAL